VTRGAPVRSIRTGRATGRRVKERAELFRYVGLDVSADTLTGTYDLDGRTFVETVTFEGVKSLEAPAVVALAQLWYLIAGLSYYKAGRRGASMWARRPSGPGPSTPQGRALRRLGEFAYRNQIPLSDVTIEGRSGVEPFEPFVDTNRVLTPFGGGIDSVVTTERLRRSVDQTLFVVSPSTGRFNAARGDRRRHRARRRSRVAHPRPPDRARRRILLQRSRAGDGDGDVVGGGRGGRFGRGGVALSNEHSSSVANLRWYNSDINHQWSKSWNAENLIGHAIAERVGDELVVASYLRDRSELWVAQMFSELEQYHHVFRSCNRAFAQVLDQRSPQWVRRM